MKDLELSLITPLTFSCRFSTALMGRGGYFLPAHILSHYATTLLVWSFSLLSPRPLPDYPTGLMVKGSHLRPNHTACLPIHRTLA